MHLEHTCGPCRVCPQGVVPRADLGQQRKRLHAKATLLLMIQRAVQRRGFRLRACLQDAAQRRSKDAARTPPAHKCARLRIRRTRCMLAQSDWDIHAQHVHRRQGHCKRSPAWVVVKCQPVAVVPHGDPATARPIDANTPSLLHGYKVSCVKNGRGDLGVTRTQRRRVTRSHDAQVFFTRAQQRRSHTGRHRCAVSARTAPSPTAGVRACPARRTSTKCKTP
ncbi:hypothetical protein FHR55_000132 [Xanthomonas arboricola]